MRLILAILLLLVCVPADAGWYQYGQTNWFQWHDTAGAHDGYWYWRAWDGYRYSYQKTNYSIAGEYLQRQSSYGSALERLLEIEKYKQKYLAEAAVANQEHAQFLGVLKVLNHNAGGLDYEKFRLRDYGETLYGSSYKRQADPRFDVNSATANFITLAREMSKGSSLTASEAAAFIQKATEAEQHIQASNVRGLNNEAALKQLKEIVEAIIEKKVPKPDAVVKPVTQGDEPDAGPAADVSDDAGAEKIVQSAKALIKARCAECHNSTKANGDVDFSSLAKLTDKQHKAIKRVLTTVDPAVRMPPADKGHKPLDGDQTELILLGIRLAGDKD